MLSTWIAALIAFTVLFSFRYLRFVVHIFAYLCYQPCIPLVNATYNASDVTAVMASVTPEGSDFVDTVKSLLDAGCAKLIVVTIEAQFEQARELCESISPRIEVLRSQIANKRIQLSIGLRQVSTSIVLFADDHIWFTQPAEFLRSVLSPFEDSSVGGVAIGKRVRRETGLGWFSIADLLNFIACTYLERHNFDLAATNTIDGGVFVISGRCAAYRSSVICAESFLQHFCREFWFFGIGPLHADDDNCITRWLVDHGWKIKFQYSAEAIMHTCLGVDGLRKYNAQCLRWVRTTWRSNSTCLFRDGTVWHSQPWCVYAVYISSFFNFALFTDAALVILAYYGFSSTEPERGVQMGFLIGWILLTKIAKLLPHFYRHPRDILYFPVYVLFAYYHSFVKLWALFTVGSLTWGSRPNIVA